jgi:tetratricopeptide (TPR) repeat protein
MGVLAVGVGKIQEALPFFKTALEANPSIGQFWLSYIDALIKLDRVVDAQSVLFEAKGKGAKGKAFDQLEQRVNAPNEVSIDPPQEQLQPIINLYIQGQLQQALSHTTKMLEQFPDSVVLYNISGAANAGLGQLDTAIDSYKQALKIKPDFADVYNNMGLVLHDKGNSEAAIESYKQALKIKPDYADAYYNMGITLNVIGNLESTIDSYKKAIKIKSNHAEAYNNMGAALNDNGDFESAIDSCRQAIQIKPDFAEAYNNMGHTLQNKGDLEAAVDSYKQALKIKPDYAEANANLVSLLTSYTPQKENLNLIITVNEAIRKIEIPSKSSHIISDEQIVNLFLESSSSLSGNSLAVRTELSQTYRRNSVDLNCKRHKSIFNEHDIIPEFCFGCYKVQVEPRSIIELIKLYVVFDQLHLKENNTRKCMVELRPEISGFYKGLIYCSGLKQANEIADYLDKVVKQSIGLGLPAKVKRGCSEYSSAFPDYKEINNSGPQLMNYIEEWKVIEEDHDRLNPMHPNENVMESLSGLNLNDVLIMQKWVDYAKGIGDPKADLINETTVYYQEIHDKAKARLKSFQFIR